MASLRFCSFSRALAVASLLGALCSAGARAAEPPVAPSPTPRASTTAPVPTTTATTATPSAPTANEPFVRETVIEDDRARIEELRVRGQLQRVTVAPKGRAPAYEIVTGEGARDFPNGEATSRGAVGKRVWNVLRF